MSWWWNVNSCSIVPRECDVSNLGLHTWCRLMGLICQRTERSRISWSTVTEAIYPYNNVRSPPLKVDVIRLLRTLLCVSMTTRVKQAGDVVDADVWLGQQLNGPQQRWAHTASLCSRCAVGWSIGGDWGVEVCTDRYLGIALTTIRNNGPLDTCLRPLA